MLSVYRSFHQQSNMVAKETIFYKIYLGLKFKFLLKPVKPKTGLKPVFNNQKPVCQKNGINIPTCDVI